MKLFDTLSENDKISLMNGGVVGIFPSMFEPSDLYYTKIHNMCFGYYMSHSGEKPISVAFEKLIELVNEGVVSDTADYLMGRMIRSKFIEKWNRVYEVLISEQYDALNNHDFTEHKTADNSDVKTFNTSVVDDGKTGTHEVVTRESNDNSNIYGVNSSVPVGDTDNISVDEETVVGDKDKNTTHNERIKSGTEGRDIDRDEERVRTGRSGSGASLVKEELNLRNSVTFMDTIFRDIDSMATLKIYL